LEFEKNWFFYIRELFEFVAFSFQVPNLSLKPSVLPLPVPPVSFASVHLAKQATINHGTTTVMTQRGVLVTQLVKALS
jgi:hypothetical protein